jgi:hypothetical protein
VTVGGSAEGSLPLEVVAEGAEGAGDCGVDAERAVLHASEEAAAAREFTHTHTYTATAPRQPHAILSREGFLAQRKDIAAGPRAWKRGEGEGGEVQPLAEGRLKETETCPSNA